MRVKTAVLMMMIIAALSLPAAAESPDDILIIANNSLGLTKIDLGQIRQIFLRERNQLGGRQVVPVHALSSSVLRSQFVKKIFNMTPAEEKNFWQNQMIRTGARPPSEVKDTLRAVFSLKSGISYCYRRDYKPGVARIVAVL